MMTTQDKAIAIGSSSLTGWQGTVGRAVARPISRHSRFSEQQVEALLGFLLLGYAAYRFAKPLIRAAKNARVTSSS
jgi:hypothetical protein